MKSKKPTQVRVAVSLFYLALALVLITPFIAPYGMRPTGSLIAGSVVGALVTVFLIEFMSIGRSWARIAYLVLAIVTPLIHFFYVKQGISTHYIGAVSIAVQVLAHGVGLYLLFTSPGKFWFVPPRR